MKTYLLSLLLTIFYISTVYGHSKVLLKSVETLTLNRGQYTTGRRNSPVPQLRCVGGSAKGQYTPAVVQCYNRGFDGRDVQWECRANLPKEYHLGRISVTCEGFDYPDDPYILAGSCGLEYELDVSPLGSAQYGKKTPSAPYYDDDEYHVNWTGIFYFIAVCVIIYIIYVTLSGSGGNGGDANRGQGYGWFPGGGGGGPNGGDGPSPPGWRPPPSYDQATKGAGTSTGTTGGGYQPGFWSGLGLGAAGGYFFGNRNRNNYDSGFRRRHYPSQFERDTGFYDQPSTSHYRPSSPGPSSSSRHESTSFGGTTRR